MNRFAFFGTSEFAVPILEALKKTGMAPGMIVTTPDRPSGRGLKSKPSPVKEWAVRKGVSLLQPENLKSPEFVRDLLDTRYPTAVVASYGKIIPKEVLDIFTKGILNVHPSLLPRWRGADPVRAAILAGDEKTGVTIMLMDEKMDHGPILESRILNLESGITYEKLKKELSELGGKLLIETLPKWLAGEIEPQEQEHEKATYTKKIKKEDGHIDWKEPAEIIERKVRALNPWPGTYTFWDEKRVKILETTQVRLGPKGGPSRTCAGGTVFKHGFELAIVSNNGALVINKLQLEGKRPQNGNEFLNGHPDMVGTTLK